MRFDRFPGGGELPVMHERPTLVIKAPQLAGDEFAVAFKESGRSGRLVLVERFTFRIGLWLAGGADVMQLEIAVQLHHDFSMARSQARKRQRLARQVHGECWSSSRIVGLAESQVRRVAAGGGVVGTGFKVDPAWLPGQTGIVVRCERQRGMAACTADLLELRLTEENRTFHRGVVGYHSARNGHGGLEQGNRGDIGDRQLVSDTISVGVGIEPEALFGLHAMVMVERVVAELPYRNNVADLMQRPDDQTRCSGAGTRQARSRQALNPGDIPGAINVVRQYAKGNSLRHQLDDAARRGCVTL